MKKAIYNRQGNQVVETGHKTFDRQTNAISHGNIIANTMYGSYIRSYTETECNGFDFPVGHLFNVDMKPFIERMGLRNQRIIEYIKKETEARQKSVILYCFFHWRNGERIVHGYILTDWDYNHIQTFYGERYSSKSISVLDECKQYVCN